MEVTKDIRYVGVDDRSVDLFEGQYPVPNGISYNSYVIMDNKIAVMDDGRVKGVFTPGQLFSGSTADEMGVELPSVTKFARMLSARGLNVGDDITDENQLIRAIQRAQGVTG